MVHRVTAGLPDYPVTRPPVGGPSWLFLLFSSAKYQWSLHLALWL